MEHQRIAKTRAASGAEVHDSFRQATLFEQFDKLRGDGGRIARRLQDDRIAADNRSHRHARHDRAGKIPGRNHGPYPEWNIGWSVALARNLYCCFTLGETQGSTGERDTLTYIPLGVG